MGRVIPAFAQFFNEGVPLANGWLQFLVSGTNNTNKDTYADSIYQILNENPLQLDAEGRCPNVFGTGDYRIVSFINDPEDEDSPGQQLQVFDPVTAQGTISCGAGSGTVFDEWDSGTTYAINSIVQQNNNIYRSLLTSNIGLDPTIETYAWEQVEFLSFYNSTINYSMGDLVYDGSNLWLSLQNSNSNNSPSISPDYWRQTASGYKGFINTATAYSISTSDRDNIIVLTPSAPADAEFTLPSVGSSTDLFRIALYNASDYLITLNTSGTTTFGATGLTSMDIDSGAVVELIYDVYLDVWLQFGYQGATLGNQDLGTLLNPLKTAYLIDAQIVNDITFTGADNSIIGDTIRFIADTALWFVVDSTARWVIPTTGNLIPWGSDLYDIGASGNRVKDIYQGDNCTHYFGATQNLTIYHTGITGWIICDTDLNFVVSTADNLRFKTSNTDRWLIDASGHLVPFAAATYDIGGVSNEIRNIYQCDNGLHYFGSDNDSVIYHSGSVMWISCSTGNMRLRTVAAQAIDFSTTNILRWAINSDGHILPASDNVYDIGSYTNHVSNFWVDTIHMRYAGSIDSNGLDIRILPPSNGSTVLGSNGSIRWYVSIDGDFSPLLDNVYDIGAPSTCVATIYYHTLSACSDERVKVDIKDAPGLELVSLIKPISFRFKDCESKKVRFGVSAQQVESVAPEFEGVSYDKKSDRYGMDYTQLIGPIIKAIQELKEIVDDQTEQLGSIRILEPDNR